MQVFHWSRPCNRPYDSRVTYKRRRVVEAKILLACWLQLQACLLVLQACRLLFTACLFQFKACRLQIFLTLGPSRLKLPTSLETLQACREHPQTGRLKLPTVL